MANTSSEIASKSFNIICVPVNLVKVLLLTYMIKHVTETSKLYLTYTRELRRNMQIRDQ